MDFSHIDINTQRLRIRPIATDDAAAVFDCYRDKQTMQYWSCLPFQQLSQAQKLVDSGIKAFCENSSLLLAIEFTQTQQVIGTMSVFNIHPDSQRAEIGYLLSRPYWQQGLMTEALNALCDYCFNSLKLNRLEADIDPNNIASAALLIKLGFKLEGYLTQRWIVNGIKTDSELYGLLKSGFSYQPQ